MESKMDIEALFRAHYRPLCLYALHYLGDAAQAEDVVQDAFAALWQASSAGSGTGDADREPAPVSRPRAYLSAAVRNRCVDALRRRKSSGAAGAVSLDDLLPRDMDGLISDDEAILRSEREARLWAAVSRLPDRRRTILLMAKRDGMSHAAIAAELGLSENTVRNQISRALESLRSYPEALLSYTLLLFP